MSSETFASSTPDYTMGYSEEYLRFLTRERDSQKIDHLRPLLQPGQRVLDLGCGPGQVTVEIAEAVAPGEVWGIDIEPSQIELAHEAASERNCDDGRFETADGADLPFDDNHFDIVVCCDVLAYVPDVSGVLSEVLRVLKPGGNIFCREMVIDSSFAHPSHPLIERGWRIFADLLESDDGHPQLGKELGERLYANGFTGVSQTIIFDTFFKEHETSHFYRFVTEWFLGPSIQQAALRYGVEEEHEAEELLRQMQVWLSTPGAVAALAFGIAHASKP